MDLSAARDICHSPYQLGQRGPQDRTLDFADEAIAQERREEAADIEAANKPRSFLEAAYELEVAAINLRAYCRGMISDEGAHAEIDRARHALAQMEQALG